MKKNIIKGVILLFLTLVLSYFLSEKFGKLYEEIIGLSGSFIDTTALIGSPLAYIFFISLLFKAFMKDAKYWWIGILLIPAAIFELYFDAAHIYFPIILGLIGWVIGLAISKLIKPKQVV